MPSREGDFELIKETKFITGSESDNGFHGLILKRLDDLENKLKSDINEILHQIGEMKKGFVFFYFRKLKHFYFSDAG